MKRIFFVSLLIIIVTISLLNAEYNFQKEKVKNGVVFKNSLEKEKLNKIKNYDFFKFFQHDKKRTNHNFQNIIKVPNITRDEISIFINGEENTSITQGEDFIMTVYFSDECNSATVQIWVDMNGNGTLEEDEDFLIQDDDDEIIDNDIEDENPETGVYQKTFYAEDDGPNNVGNLGLLFSATDEGGNDVAFLYINALVSDYSVSGHITPELPNIVVGAFSLENEITWMVMTDSEGNYQSFVNEAGYYMVMTFDPLGITGGMYPDTTYTDVLIDGHLTGYDFHYLTPSSTISGTVLDNYGNPIEGVEVRADQEDMMGIFDTTDENGNYTIGVSAGFWRVGINENDLIPDYLVPENQYVFVEEDENVVQNFVAYVVDATIEGTVYLDETPVAGIRINGNNSLGYTETISEFNGSYILPVSTFGDNEGGYSVNIWDLPPDTYVDEYYNGIVSGSTGIDFHIHSASGGIEGYLFDAESEEPLEDGWVSATQDYQTWYNTGIEEDGYYHLALPNGIYDVFANADDYYQETAFGVEIQDEFVYYEFYLEPVTFDGALWGYIYEQGTGNPIENANIWVSNEEYWDGTTSDEDGYYYIPLPNGTYWVDVNKPGYTMVHLDEIEINNLEVQQNFYLTPIIYDGSLSGYVYEDSTEIPLENVWIWVYNQDYWVGTFTDATGYYYVDLPNGTYSLNANKDGYEDFYSENIEVYDEDVILDIYMMPIVSSDENEIKELLLLQNFPNPFKNSTVISFSVGNEQNRQNEQNTISIYNIKGQKIRQFSIPNFQFSIVWDGTDNFGKKVSPGIYLYQLKIDDKTVANRKCILLR